jgi:hypothetical protein
MFLSVDGGRSKISSSGTTQEAPSMFRSNGWCSWISGTTSQGGRHLRFLVLMVGAPGSPIPPRMGMHSYYHLVPLVYCYCSVGYPPDSIDYSGSS